jgi:hypothetical protein
VISRSNFEFAKAYPESWDDLIAFPTCEAENLFLRSLGCSFECRPLLTAVPMLLAFVTPSAS